MVRLLREAKSGLSRFLTTLLKTGMPEIAKNRLIYLGFEGGSRLRVQRAAKNLFSRAVSSC
jgi:hypothetical protein